MIKKPIVIFAAIMPNFIRIFLYKLIGYKIGRHVKIAPFTLLIADKVEIGDNVRIGALNLFKLGNLKIGSETIIRSLNMFIGEKNLTIGRRSQVTGPFVFMNLAEDIEIGDESGIGSHSIIYTHGALLPYLEGEPRRFEKVKIGNRTWVHTDAVILPGVTIGDSSIIFAGSVVSSSYPENSFIMGNPSRRVSDADKLRVPITGEERKKRMNEMLENFGKIVHADKKAFHQNRLEIIKGKTKTIIIIGESHNPEGKEDLILFGWGVKPISSKNVSFFDVKTRKMRIKSHVAEEFHDYLGKYAEYFREA